MGNEMEDARMATTYEELSKEELLEIKSELEAEFER